MTIQLIEYSTQYETQTIERIALFFGFHTALIHENYTLTQTNYDIAAETLRNWLIPPNKLFMVTKDDHIVGFLRLSYRGPNVAWIEDIFVDQLCRNQGIATQAIKIAENLIKETPEYTAICLDVAPRNDAALKLYHTLGYDNLSIITVRKELNGNKYDRKTSFAELEFNY